MRKNTNYSPELANEICHAISCSSYGIKKLCKLNKHWPSHDTIYRWLSTEKEFSDLYARAKRFQMEVIIDEILEIADDTSKDIIINDGKPIIDHEHINRSRLRIDTRKWLASKLCPRLYGNEERINLDFPNDTSNSNSLIKMSVEVFRALSNQEISPEQAKIIAGVIKDHRNNIVLSDLNERMTKFENQANHYAK